MERGEFEIVPASDWLQPFVRRHLYVNRPLKAEIVLHAKPTGYAYFSNFFGRNSRDFGIIDGLHFTRTDRWFLFGQIVDHDVHFHHVDSMEIIACELTATAPYRLFGFGGGKILGMASAFETAAPHLAALARECFRLGADASREEHVAEAERFFALLVPQAAPVDAATERAVFLLEAANGALRIADLCREVGLGPRQLNRRFRDLVGLSPKTFAQILQINWVVGLLYANDTARLTEIAHDAGFYDQAHFNRAMQRFFKEGPREFLKSDHPAFRTFLAQSRRFGPASQSEA